MTCFTRQWIRPRSISRMRAGRHISAVIRSLRELESKQKHRSKTCYSFSAGGNEFKDCDYVTAWYVKSAEFIQRCEATFGFVSTSSISEGEQVAHLWSRLYGDGCHIIFAHQGFKWRNNASDNAAVQCVIIGVGRSK